ncbi:DUF6236 family protein [Mucilaginibacter paludis]|uniref:Uncharacterized protein n=1 Tax=Mucilaginibacter paludis DSM 18603 TaxID=714943 RepID=H1Y166_9SPHI|nr:DUF6236 family protein [Mucilaginibacter paludis]EHQ29701.1 hypothetical protein Mucpa_5632 [Mucilaginibacter paludis DSM 18603]
MQRNLLYYPSIDIPHKEWLLSALLYADTVSTIVPYTSISDDRMPNDLRELYDQEIYKPVLIEKVLTDYQQEFGEFEQRFISATTSEEFKALSNKKLVDQPGFLFEQKLTMNIKYHLQQEHLIKGQGGLGIATDETVALLYMSFLAQYVAKVTENELVIPSTDLKKYEHIGFNLTKEKMPAFAILLDRVLPVPGPDATLEQVIQFKKDRKDELFQFRKYLSAIQEKIRKAETKEQLLEVLIDARESIEKGIHDLQKTMKDGGIKSVFTSFESLLKLESPKLFATLTAAGIVSTPVNPVVGVITGAIGIAGGMISSYMGSKREVDKADLSYLFKAQKAGIIHAG